LIVFDDDTKITILKRSFQNIHAILLSSYKASRYQLQLINKIANYQVYKNKTQHTPGFVTLYLHN